MVIVIGGLSCTVTRLFFGRVFFAIDSTLPLKFILLLNIPDWTNCCKGFKQCNLVVCDLLPYLLV